MKVIAFVLAVAMILSLTPTGTVIAVDEEPAPRLHLSGIAIKQVPGESGGDPTYQAVYTLSITNQDIATAGFTLRYNKDYLQPSDADTNEVISVAGDRDRLDAMYTDDATLMDAGIFTLPTVSYFNCPAEVSGNYGLLSYTLGVMSANETDPNPIKGNQDDGATIGTFSFQLNNSKIAELSTMEVSQLKELVTLYADTAGTDCQKLYAGWTDEDGKQRDFADMDLWEVDLELHMPPESAEAILLNDTVTAYEIYSTGTVEDLFNYIRDNSTSAIVTFLGGSTSVEPFQWGSNTDTTGMVLSAGTYDPKGGTYTVSQTDPDLGEVTVDVTVKPVKATGFKASTNDYVCYEPGTQPADISAITDFPTSARILYDILLPSAAIRTVGISGAWAQTAPDTPTYYTDGTPSYTFTAEIEQADLPGWVTLDTTASVDVVRFVGYRADAPTVLCAEVQDDGTLIIMVEALDPENRDFVVRLPDGTELVPTVAAGETYTDKDGNTHTGVKVTVDPSITGTPEIVKESLNLGGSGFGIAVTESDTTPPEYGESEFTNFELDPRNNYFTTDGAADGSNYVFDYSGSNKGKYPIIEGASLPTTFTLPGADFVSTTYDGADGSEYGKLQTFEVIWDTPTGDPSKPGQDVEYTGTIQTTTTANGIVTNPNNIRITVKVTTVEAATYIVTLKTNPADGSYGTLTLGGDAESTSFTAGSPVMIVVTPANGYKFIGFTCVPSTVMPVDAGAGDGSYTFTMPASNVTVTARFQADSSAAIEDIAVYKSDDDTAIYSLHEYSDGLGAEVTFDPDIREYYVRVPAETESVKLLVSAGSEPGVTYTSDTVATDMAVPVTDDGSGGFETDAIPLNDTAPDLGNPAGFNNIVTITIDSTEYMVYIQKLIKPVIVLNYGNSPYGMIMKDPYINEANSLYGSTDADAIAQWQTDAKAAFDEGNRFTSTYMPKDAINKIYHTSAWNDATDADHNMDRNDYAIFVYNRTDFRDPGFELRDALGNLVDATQVTRYVEDLKRSTTSLSGLENPTTTARFDLSTGVSDMLYTTITDKSGSVQPVKPGVYKLHYEYLDKSINPDGELISGFRYLIVLNEIGDADFSGGVNTSDGTTVNAIAVGTVYAGIDALFMYRVADADNSGGVNTSDTTTVNSIAVGNKEQPFYNALPDT